MHGILALMQGGAPETAAVAAWAIGEVIARTLADGDAARRSKKG